MLASTAATATAEVARLASRVVRRLDAGLVEAAARNAETGVQAARLRGLEELRTLRELSALPGFALPTQATADAADAARDLTAAAARG